MNIFPGVYLSADKKLILVSKYIVVLFHQAHNYFDEVRGGPHDNIIYLYFNQVDKKILHESIVYLYQSIEYCPALFLL